MKHLQGTSIRGGQRHERIFDLLETLAVDVETVTRSKHACAIVYGNKILSVGTNRGITHPIQKKYASHETAIWVHAEIDAIAKATRRYGPELLQKSSLYVLRLRYENGHPRKQVRGQSKPCIGCQGAINAFRIKKVFYTTSCGFECF